MIQLDLTLNSKSCESIIKIFFPIYVFKNDKQENAQEYLLIPLELGSGSLLQYKN